MKIGYGSATPMRGKSPTCRHAPSIFLKGLRPGGLRPL